MLKIDQIKADDGQIRKIQDSELAGIIKGNFATPEMYGAVGDGETDDTQAFKNMLAECTSITIPAKRYKITEKLQTKPNTYITGCGKDSVIVCHSLADLFLVNAYNHLTNFSITIETKLSGAVFKINNETLVDCTLGDGALGTKIDKVWIGVSKSCEVVDPQLACFEISNTGYWGTNKSGFWDINISNIEVIADPSQGLGYFYKAFTKNKDDDGKNFWTSGVNVSTCKIYGARWGFFLSESDENIFDTEVLGTTDTLSIFNVQHQKTGTNCKAFIYVRRGASVELFGCCPWDWSAIGADDTKYPYLVDDYIFYNQHRSSANFVVHGLDPNKIILFASITEDGALHPFAYGHYTKLEMLGTEIRPFGLMPKIMGMCCENGAFKTTTMLVYKRKIVSAQRTIHFDIYRRGNWCRVMVIRTLDGNIKAVLDKDLSVGTQLYYKEADSYLYLYIYSGTDTRPYDGLVRSVELSNDNVAYSDSERISNYNNTINCWDIPHDERYLAELPSDAVKITDITVNAFVPVLTSENGTRYQLKVDNYGNVITGSRSETNSQLLISPNGTMYKLSVDDSGVLTVVKVTDAPKTYPQSWAKEY